MEEKQVKRLGQIYSYTKLSNYEGLKGDLDVRAPTTFVGVEVELEEVKCKHRYIGSSIKVHNDGSLKLKGMEFVTVPIRVCYLEHELKRLFGSINPPHISSRCSIHVHLNVRDMTEEELYRFVLLYLIFEQSLFNYSGGRNKNIFCIPLASQIDRVSRNIKKLTKPGAIKFIEWTKYFALNLCPIWGNGDEGSSRFGTVEFRHMAGTTNIERIIEWINLIVSLKITAKKFTTKELIDNIRVMNTTSGYYWLTKEAFKGWADIISSQRTFKDDVEKGILMAKFCTSLIKEREEIIITKEKICAV